MLFGANSKVSIEHRLHCCVCAVLLSVSQCWLADKLLFHRSPGSAPAPLPKGEGCKTQKRLCLTSSLLFVCMQLAEFTCTNTFAAWFLRIISSCQVTHHPHQRLMSATQVAEARCKHMPPQMAAYPWYNDKIADLQKQLRQAKRLNPRSAEAKMLGRQYRTQLQHARERYNQEEVLAKVTTVFRHLDNSFCKAFG